MIDTDALVAWMDSKGLGAGPLEHGFIAGGSQNEIYELRRGDLHCALRIPPQSAPESRDDGIFREWRIIEALEGTEVPHTPAVAVCTDKSVLGRTFYLMGFVDGWSPMGLTVDESGHRAVDAGPVVDRGPPQSGRVRDGGHVQHEIRRAAERGVHDHRVVDGIVGHDVTRAS